ncbi:MAG: hypothetical protein AAGG08_11755, partial [Actinomycetota bacterium]
NDLRSWTNPPPHLLAAEVEGHAEFAVAQALASPLLDLAHVVVHPLGGDTWQVDVGVQNVGWLPTYVSERAKSDRLTRPVEVEVSGDGVEVLDGPTMRELGQLDGSMSARFDRGRGGSPERAMTRFTIRAAAGSDLVIDARHERAGRRSRVVTLS